MAPCSKDTPTLAPDHIDARLASLGGWTRAESWIEKTFRFKSFLGAMSFVNAVAFAAESMNHHPDIAVRYREVTLQLWTHATGGLTEFDFTLAEKIEELNRENESRRALG